MKLTLQTDYALRALIYLGVRTEGLCSIRQIAQAYQVSEGHMIKVIHRLGMGGFIETIRGRNGGVRLGRAPETILIGAVVRYMEEDLSLLACMEPDAERKADLCALMPGCRLRGVLSQAMGALLGVLDHYTLADVITPHERQRLTEKAD